MSTEMILNQISPTNFRVDIPDNSYMKGLTLQVQGVTLPSMNLPAVDIPANMMVRGKVPGSAFEFDPLMIRFVVDEEMRSYLGIYIWMLSTNDYNEFNSVAWDDPKQSFAVHILDNSQMKTIATFRFYGAFPTNLGEVELGYTNDSDEAVTCMATFCFLHMEVEIDGKVVTSQKRMS